MEILSSKVMKFFHFNSLTCKCVALLAVAFLLRAILLSDFSSAIIPTNKIVLINDNSSIERLEIKTIKFLEVPQIVWGLNNQKIAFARACLTARMMNRTLLMPSLSASLFYKEIDKLQPIDFEKVFNFKEFNLRCKGFVQLGRYSDILNKSDVFDLQKGSGRKWTVERDLDQLMQFSRSPYKKYEIIKIIGKNPFLWHDHWPVEDYAKVFECLVLVDEISKEADKVVTKIQEMGIDLSGKGNYVAVHMRIEKDWMIHCKNMEQRSNMSEICSSKSEIMQRVGHIRGLKTPLIVYLAVADTLLEDNSLFIGWKEGLIPYEKKKLGVMGIYEKYPYLIQSAIDYEVCSRADIFVGNSFSTFSNLIVLDRTQKLRKMGVTSSCDGDVRWVSYAYNILGEYNGPKKWMMNMSAPNLQAISYGSNEISC